jgi:hypothetical protein
MKCEEVRNNMADVAAGYAEPDVAMQDHLKGCGLCAAELVEFRQTMAVLDEWMVPEPSPFFDTRFQARLREEKVAETERRRGWLFWLPRTAFAATAAILVALLSVGIWQHSGRPSATASVAVEAPAQQPSVERGTAVGDLQTLDSDNDLYANFDLLDDLDTQQDTATATN